MFTSKISLKAWAIFREICPKEFGQYEGSKALIKRNYFSEAVKSAYEYFKALKRGVVKFVKIKDYFTGEAEICERKIMSLEDYGYAVKSDRKVKESQFVFIDVEKAFVGKVREFVSFHSSQLIW